MKRLILVMAVAFMGLSMQAQEGFFVKAGLASVSIKAGTGGASVSSSEIGFFGGVGYNIAASETFEIEPSVLFSSVKDLTSLYVPIMAKYKVSEDFSIQAGPQVNYLLEDLPQGKLGIDIAFGAGYNITEELFVDARYGLEVSRDIPLVSFNTLHVGIGYRF